MRGFFIPSQRAESILRRFLKRSVLNQNVIRSSEDAFVDQLFAAAAEIRCTLDQG